MIWRLLRACSDAPVRADRTRHPRHFAARGCGTAPAGAENLVRPGGSCRGREWRGSGRVAPGWFLPGGSVGCGMMIGCADATGLPECEERVRVTAFAAGE